MSGEFEPKIINEIRPEYVIGVMESIEVSNHFGLPLMSKYREQRISYIYQQNRLPSSFFKRARYAITNIFSSAMIGFAFSQSFDTNYQKAIVSLFAIAEVVNSGLRDDAKLNCFSRELADLVDNWNNEDQNNR